MVLQNKSLFVPFSKIRKRSGKSFLPPSGIPFLRQGYREEFLDQWYKHIQEGRGFWGGVSFSAAGPGTFGYVQIFNPVKSPVIIDIKFFYFILDVGQSVAMSEDNVARLTFSRTGKNLRSERGTLIRQKSNLEFRTQESAAIFGEDISTFNIAANQRFSIDDWSLQLQPGQGLTARSLAPINIQCFVLFSERPNEQRSPIGG